MNHFKSKRMYTIIYGLVFLIGLAFTYYAIKHYKVSRRIVTAGIRTDATVIDFATIADSDGDSHAPVYEFFDLSGERIEFESKVHHSQPSMKVGDIMEVIYNPNKHQEVKIVSYWGIYRWTIILLIFASPFLIMGGGYLLYIIW